MRLTAELADGWLPFGFVPGMMGHERLNFHKQLMARRGYAREAERVQELFLARRRDEAAAVLDEYVDDAALIGPPKRLRERFLPWLDSGATGITVHGTDDRALRLLADVAG